MAEANRNNLAALLAVMFFVAIAPALSVRAEALLPDSAAPAMGRGIREPAELRIGPTGIYCFTEPCPWKGIVLTDETDEVPGHILWWGTDLPQLDATPEIMIEVAETWKNDTCLNVMGQLFENTLIVMDILGEC